MPDVIIVGGGLIGMGIAWRTAQAGAQVTVVDPTPGAGASRVAAGMLAPITELHYGEEALLRLNLESNSMFPAFAAELEDSTGRPSGFHQTGTLAVGFDGDDMAVLADLHDFQRSLGLSVERLTSRDCRRLEPLLAPSVRGGLLVNSDNQADPRQLHATLQVAAEKAGVVVRRERADEFVVEDAGSVDRTEPAEADDAMAVNEEDATGDRDVGPEPSQRRAPEATASRRAVGVRLADGTRLSAATVVLAAGCWSASIPGLPQAILPPVRPVKGQLLRLRMRPAADPTAAGSAGAGALGHTVRAVVRGSAVYVVPRPTGEVVVGATSEELGFDTTVTAGAVYELLRDARALIPTITELAVEEASAGLRPGTPDNGPILGWMPLEGLVVATGHYRNGVLLTPLTAAAIAELVTTGRAPDVIKPFGPGRFRTTRVEGDRRDSDQPPAPVRSGAAARLIRSGWRPA